MTDTQGYVAFLSRLLVEYGNDPEKCETIKQQDIDTGPGLLSLLLEWYAKDHPDLVKTVTERGTLESAECRDVVHRCGRGE